MRRTRSFSLHCDQEIPFQRSFQAQRSCRRARKKCRKERSNCNIETRFLSCLRPWVCGTWGTWGRERPTSRYTICRTCDRTRSSKGLWADPCRWDSFRSLASRDIETRFLSCLRPWVCGTWGTWGCETSTSRCTICRTRDRTRSSKVLWADSCRWDSLQAL
jgi:hypothetical protein